MSARCRRICVRLGRAFLRPTGRAQLWLDLVDGTTAAGLREALGRALPEARPLLPVALLVAGDRVLASGDLVPVERDEIALVLPTAGG